MIRTRIGVIPCVAALSLLSLESQAIPPREPSAQAAQARFAAAQKLFDKGKYEEARSLFQELYEASKSPNARLMVGRCLSAQERWAEAYDELAATAREATSRAQSEPKYAVARDSAAAQLTLLELKIGKLVIALPEPGAEVSVNGKALPAGQLGVPLTVMPGMMVVVAQRPDGTSVRREQVVKAGETKTVSLIFAPPPPPPSSPPPPPPPAPVAPLVLEKEGGGVRVAGFVIGGLGLAGMGVFGVTQILAQGKFSTLEQSCNNARCTDIKYAQVVDDGKTFELISRVGLIAGGVGILSGVLMIALGGPTPKAPAQVGIDVSPEGAKIHVGGTF